jgi:hypothetical protein
MTRAHDLAALAQIAMDGKDVLGSFLGDGIKGR